MADLLAKDGALGLGTETHISPPPSSTAIKAKIKETIKGLWNTRWKNGSDARQTKIFFPEICTKKAKEIRTLSRDKLSKTVRALTGHDFRRRHESIIKGNGEKTCRFCLQEEESSDHIVNRCPRLMWKRMEIFRIPLGSATTPHWRPKQLAAFLSDPTISEMETPDREY